MNIKKFLGILVVILLISAPVYAANCYEKLETITLDESLFSMVEKYSKKPIPVPRIQCMEKAEKDKLVLIVRIYHQSKDYYFKGNDYEPLVFLMNQEYSNFFSVKTNKDNNNLTLEQHFKVEDKNKDLLICKDIYDLGTLSQNYDLKKATANKIKDIDNMVYMTIPEITAEQ